MPGLLFINSLFLILKFFLNILLLTKRRVKNKNKTHIEKNKLSPLFSLEYANTDNKNLITNITCKTP